MSQAENSSYQPNTNEIEGSQQAQEDQQEPNIHEEPAKVIEYSAQEKNERKNPIKTIIERRLTICST